MPTKDPEKKRAQHARYREKHKEKLRANAKAKHAERMANDPEYVAKQKEKSKRAQEAYKLRMATDPEYAEKERAKAKAKYNPEKIKEYYNANRDRLLAQSKEWHKKNPEYAKQYYKQNKEKIDACTKAWMKENPERVKEFRKEYTEKNREKINAQALAGDKRRFEENPEKVRATRKANKQKQFEKDPEGYLEKRRKWVQASSKRMVDEARNNYIAHLLAKSTGVKLAPSEIPKELIEVKRLQLKILREVKNEKCNRA